jgi:preprotein translocase subunit SecY
MPFNVGARSDPDMTQAMGTILLVVYYSLAIAGLIIPFAYFYYEAQDADSKYAKQLFST